jgi:hypothetical protein
MGVVRRERVFPLSREERGLRASRRMRAYERFRIELRGP